MPGQRYGDDDRDYHGDDILLGLVYLADQLVGDAEDVVPEYVLLIFGSLRQIGHDYSPLLSS